jgi:hypothetical protein
VSGCQVSRAREESIEFTCQERSCPGLDLHVNVPLPRHQLKVFIVVYHDAFHAGRSFEQTPGGE